jgi:DNA-binding LacI/PurR family transcriptional regulator
MPTTIKDIAKYLSISPGTVSRALQKSTRVSKETIQKVEEAAKKLKYRPNITAQRLVSGRTHNIGVILSKDIREYTSVQLFNSIILNGILEVAEAHNYNLNFAIDSQGEKQGALYRILQNHDVDGVLIINVVSEDIIATLRTNGIPVVLIDNHFDNHSEFAVNNDDRYGAYIATKHLITLGYPSVGMMGITEEAFHRECLSGYMQALTEYGLRVEPYFIQKGTGSMESTYELIREMIKNNHLPKAFFVVTDEMAIGAIQALIDSGLSVPQDVAVVGMDDIPLLDYVDPPLTTVRIYIAEMGRTAVGMLLDLIRGQYQGKNQIAIQPKLVIRKTCGAK